MDLFEHTNGTHPDNTRATASLSTLSPNTNEYKLTSTLKSLNMAKIVNGSVGEMSAPKNSTSRNVNLPLK